MTSYTDHTDIDTDDILELIAQSGEDGAALITLVRALVTFDVKSGDAAYKYVRRRVKKLVDAGTLRKTDDGKYVETAPDVDVSDERRAEINDAFNRIGEETPDPDEGGEIPRYSPDDTSEDDDSDPDDETVSDRVERQKEEAREHVFGDDADTPRSGSELAEAAMPSTVGEVAALADEDEDSGAHPLDDVLNDADEEVAGDVDEDALSDDSGTEDTLSPEEQAERKEAPVRFPADEDTETRSIKAHTKDGRANCKLGGAVLADDAVETGFIESADEAPDSSAVRVQCPHCGRTAGLRVSKDLEAKLRSHPEATGTPRPRSNFYAFRDGEWVEVDPSADDDEEGTA